MIQPDGRSNAAASPDRSFVPARRCGVPMCSCKHFSTPVRAGKARPRPSVLLFRASEANRETLCDREVGKVGESGVRQAVGIMVSEDRVLACAAEPIAPAPPASVPQTIRGRTRTVPRFMWSQLRVKTALIEMRRFSPFMRRYWARRHRSSRLTPSIETAPAPNPV